MLAATHLLRRLKAAAAVPPPGGAPAAAPPPPVAMPNPVKAPTTMAGAGAPNSFTMQLPEVGGALKPTVDGTGQALDPNTGQPMPIDPASGQPMATDPATGKPVPPPKPAEAAKASAPEKLPLQGADLVLNDLEARLKAATSGQFLGDLDRTAVGGRSGVGTVTAPAAVKPGQFGAGWYDQGRKMLLGSLLARPKKPFGAIRDLHTAHGEGIFRSAQQLEALGAGGGGSSNLKLLANWLGSQAGNALGIPEAGHAAGQMLDQATPYLQQSFEKLQQR